VQDDWPARAWYWPAGHAAHEDDSSEKKEPAGHEAGVAVDAGAVVRGEEECGAAADVVDAAVVEADISEAAVVAAADAGAVWRGAIAVVVGATAAKHELDAVCTVTYVNEFGDHATDRTLELCPASVTSVLPLPLLHTRAVPS